MHGFLEQAGIQLDAVLCFEATLLLPDIQGISVESLSLLMVEFEGGELCHQCLHNFLLRSLPHALLKGYA